MLKSSHIEELLKLNLTQNFIFQNTTPGLLLFDSSYVVIFHLCEFSASPKMRISLEDFLCLYKSFINHAQIQCWRKSQRPFCEVQKKLTPFLLTQKLRKRSSCVHEGQQKFTASQVTEKKLHSPKGHELYFSFVS